MLSLVRLFATPWTVAHQGPLSMGFPRQEYWNGLPFPSPEDFPNPGIEPASPSLVCMHAKSHRQILCHGATKWHCTVFFCPEFHAWFSSTKSLYWPGARPPVRGWAVQWGSNTGLVLNCYIQQESSDLVKLSAGGQGLGLSWTCVGVSPQTIP